MPSGRQSLNRMGNSGREVPEVAFFHVGDEALAVRIDARDARAAVQHVGPLRGGVPVQFAHATGGEAHVHAGKRLRNRKLAHRHFARPTAFLKAFVRERERVLKCLHAARVCRQGMIRIRIRGVQSCICRPRIARAAVSLGNLRRTSPALGSCLAPARSRLQAPLSSRPKIRADSEGLFPFRQPYSPPSPGFSRAPFCIPSPATLHLSPLLCNVRPWHPVCHWDKADALSRSRLCRCVSALGVGFLFRSGTRCTAFRNYVSFARAISGTSRCQLLAYTAR